MTLHHLALLFLTLSGVACNRTRLGIDDVRVPAEVRFIDGFQCGFRSMPLESGQERGTLAGFSYLTTLSGCEGQVLFHLVPSGHDPVVLAFPQPDDTTFPATGKSIHMEHVMLPRGHWLGDRKVEIMNSKQQDARHVWVEDLADGIKRAGYRRTSGDPYLLDWRRPYYLLINLQTPGEGTGSLMDLPIQPGRRADESYGNRRRYCVGQRWGGLNAHVYRSTVNTQHPWVEQNVWRKEDYVDGVEILCSDSHMSTFAVAIHDEALANGPRTAFGLVIEAQGYQPRPLYVTPNPGENFSFLNVELLPAGATSTD